MFRAQSRYMDTEGSTWRVLHVRCGIMSLQNLGSERRFIRFKQFLSLLYLDSFLAIIKVHYRSVLCVNVKIFLSYM